MKRKALAVLNCIANLAVACWVFSLGGVVGVVGCASWIGMAAIEAHRDFAPRKIVVVLGDPSERRRL